MNEKRQKLLLEKEKVLSKIKKEQTKLKKIDAELEYIEMQEKLSSADKITELLKNSGIENIEEFARLIEEGKVSIDK